MKMGKQAPLDETVADEEKNDFDDTPNKQVPEAALMKIRIKKLEDSLQLKEMECAEKDAALECLETEQIVMKEEMVKSKDDMKIKDELNET